MSIDPYEFQRASRSNTNDCLSCYVQRTLLLLYVPLRTLLPSKRDTCSFLNSWGLFKSDIAPGSPKVARCVDISTTPSLKLAHAPLALNDGITLTTVLVDDDRYMHRFRSIKTTCARLKLDMSPLSSLVLISSLLLLSLSLLLLLSAK